MVQTVKGRRGFLLVSVLLITMILLTLGLTFLGKRALQYRRASLAEQAAYARALAESGLDDALTKLRRDLEFPPLARDQAAFSYTEEVNADSGERLGAYRVTIDGNHRFPPYSVWVITSVGESGADPAKPLATRTLRLEFDLSAGLRGEPDKGNPNYYQVINFEDLGGL